MEFPLISLEAAVKEVKADNLDNAVLQSCKVPNMAGGCTDLLLGIMYASVHPVLVHQLPSGLAIYRSALASHDGFDCLTGGPHKSFDAYAGHVGGASQLLAHFAQGIQEFRTFGAPELENLPATLEEEKLAKCFNSWDGDLSEFKSIVEFKESEDIMEERFADLGVETHIQELPIVSASCSCKKLPHCCYNLSKMIEEFVVLQVIS